MSKYSYLITDPARIERMQSFIRENDYEAKDFPVSYPPANEGTRTEVPQGCKILTDCLERMLDGKQVTRKNREELIDFVKFLQRRGKFGWFMEQEPRFAAGGYAAHVLIQ